MYLVQLSLNILEEPASGHGTPHWHPVWRYRMTDYRAQLKEAVLACAFHGSAAYSWIGKPSAAIARSLKPHLTPDAERSFLLMTLQRQLYNDFYCRGRATASGFDPAPVARPSRPSRRSFRARTPAPATGREAGSCSGDGERLVVERHGLSLWLTPKDVEPNGGAAIAPGNPVRVRMAKELFGVSPGFYMALSDRDFGDGASGSVLRLYWNLTPEGAVRFMKAATVALNASAVRFRLKLLNEPAAYRRCDAGVLYVYAEDYEAVRRIIQPSYAQIGPHLKPDVPALTKWLAPGLGFAEDPGAGDSFGTQRMRLVAEGLLSARDAGARSASDRLAHVDARFVAADISLERPYLNPGSKDVYSFDWARSTGAASNNRRSLEPLTDAACLAIAEAQCVADRAGSRLARRAMQLAGEGAGGGSARHRRGYLPRPSAGPIQRRERDQPVSRFDRLHHR